MVYKEPQTIVRNHLVNSITRGKKINAPIRHVFLFFTQSATFVTMKPAQMNGVTSETDV